jgi:hypothetical protein
LALKGWDSLRPSRSFFVATAVADEDLVHDLTNLNASHGCDFGV